MTQRGPEFTVMFTKLAVKELADLQRELMMQVDECACALAENPFPVGFVPVKGRPGMFRVRQGRYRILYTVNSTSKIVVVATIGHRREVYE